jgi:uncharacterized membrane protein YeaQ/YmgE (transglycosylase-associated protein family)
MNTVVWIGAGCAVAWLAFFGFRVNLSRGFLLSLVIGAASAYFGGTFIAPLLESGVAVPGDLNLFALVVACAAAAAALIISDMVSPRSGF